MNQSHQENENMGAGRVTQKTYIIGFLLATLFTLLSFGLVVFKDSMPRTAVVILLSVAALLQMFVHLYYFLHLNKSSEQRWNVIDPLANIYIRRRHHLGNVHTKHTYDVIKIYSLLEIRAIDKIARIFLFLVSKRPLLLKNKDKIIFKKYIYYFITFCALLFQKKLCIFAPQKTCKQ